MTADTSDRRHVEVHGWPELLDRLEDDLAILDTMLEQGDVVPPQTWEPPAGLGPLPVPLRDRAEELAGRIEAAQERARERVGELADGLQQVQRRRRAGEAYANAGDPSRNRG